MFNLTYRQRRNRTMEALSEDIPTRLKQVKKAALVQAHGDVILGNLGACQAVLESRLLGVPSQLAAKYNNFFGIKGEGTDGSVELPTKEYISRKWLTVTAKFAKNLTIEDSFKQHNELLHMPRYSKVLLSKSMDEACYNVWIAGYATDPLYPKLLIKIYSLHIKPIV